MGLVGHFYALFVGLNVFGVKASFRFSVCICLAALAISSWCSGPEPDRGAGVRLVVEPQGKRPTLHMRMDHAQHEGHRLWLTASRQTSKHRRFPLAVSCLS